MKWLALIALLAAACWFWFPDEKQQPPGVLAPEAPVQTALTGASPWEFKKYRITPLADFRLKARLLAKSRYWLDREAELAPFDCVFGWGPMSDTRVLDKLDISQSSRWYYWHADTLPISEREIETHCANMHLIASSPLVRKEIGRARPGELVDLEGFLVEIRAADGWQWKSSMSRTDEGGGSCEVIWVKRFSAE